MIVLVQNPRYRLISLAVTLVIMAIVYFAVIAPSNDAANTAVSQGERQLNNAVSNAAKQSPGAIPAGVQNLTSCIAKAGTDGNALQACAAKYKK
jgi:hypothetical protein